MPSPSPGPTIFSTVRDWWTRGIAQEGFARTLRTFLAQIWGFLRDSTPEQRRRRFGDAEYDWEHRVDTTSATVGWRDRLLGVFHSPYQPTEPALFHEMLASLNIPYEDFAFIDLGSGKGRALLMASEYPFRRITGVELLPELHRVAVNNLQNYRSESQKCKRLEARCENAVHFRFPAEPTVLYLFNPLPPASLAQVVRNMERSLEQDRRPVFVIYHNPLLDEIWSPSPLFMRKGGTHQYCVYESK